MTRRAVYAGSFDPPTVGHEWMIRTGASLFDELIVAVGVNPEKRATFDVAPRRDMLRAIAHGLPNVRVDSFENQFLVRYAHDVGAAFMLRGIRNDTDAETERTLRHLNADLAPNLQTVFLMPPRALAEVSSSLVKGVIGPDGWEVVVQRLVPGSVFEAILARFVRQSPGFARFLTWWQRAEPFPGRPEAMFADLVRRYGEPHRRYHTLRHILECLERFDEIRHRAKKPDAVELAIWYHDAIYDVTRHDGSNETQSADLVAAINRDAGFLILATRDHAVASDPDAALLIDCDLAILGASPERFDEYERDIREEYRHVSDADFNTARAAILRGFLERDSIFNTPDLRERFESPARTNLARSLARLGTDHQ